MPFCDHDLHQQQIFFTTKSEVLYVHNILNIINYDKSKYPIMFQPNDVFSSGGPSAHFILPPSLEEDIMSTTEKDVLNGRGQGVQRLPGNVNYRKLVHVNKVRACERVVFHIEI